MEGSCVTEEPDDLPVWYGRLETAIHTLMTRHIDLTRAARQVLDTYDNLGDSDLMAQAMNNLRTQLAHPPGQDSRR
jgi:hypothetical protein